MRVLVAGASGFIGSHVALHLQACGHTVIAAARKSAKASRRLPDLDWIDCDFRRDDQDHWVERLTGVDAVVNCVGVLQDGLGDNSRATHVDGAAALFEACNTAGVQRIVHISAVGGDAEAGSAYGRDKQAGEDRLKACGVDWIILRPSLVIARSVYGGTALIRALCGVPWITPVVGGDQVFRPIGMEDVCAAVEAGLEEASPVNCSWDLAGPDAVTHADLMRGYRRWLGFGKTRIWDVPRWLARPAMLLGDLLGWLGMRTSMRTTALQQLDYDVAGDPGPWMAQTGARPLGFAEYLARTPASLQDRWHARLGMVRPLARLTLGAFWLASGAIALTAGAREAIDLMLEAGLGVMTSHVLLGATALFDIALGLAMLVKWRVRSAATLMVLVSLGYLAALSLLMPGLWGGALGPLVKTIPAMALALMIAATEDER